MKKVFLMLLISAAATTTITAQDNDDKGRKDKSKDKKEKSEGKREGRDDQYSESQDNIAFPRRRFPNRVPRVLNNIPRGHYPPPGECRIWYPDQPAGQQPPPVPCGSLIGIRLEPGAFILHNDKAYDTEYDWKDDKNKEREKEATRNIPREIIDILFPPKKRN